MTRWRLRSCAHPQGGSAARMSGASFISKTCSLQKHRRGNTHAMAAFPSGRRSRALLDHPGALDQARPRHRTDRRRAWLRHCRASRAQNERGPAACWRSVRVLVVLRHQQSHEDVVRPRLALHWPASWATLFLYDKITQARSTPGPAGARFLNRDDRKITDRSAKRKAVPLTLAHQLEVNGRPAHLPHCRSASRPRIPRPERVGRTRKL